jgi:hypothetical protein
MRRRKRSSGSFFSREIASQISRENYPIVSGGGEGRPGRPLPPRRPRISSLGYIIGFLFRVFIPGRPDPVAPRGYLSADGVKRARRIRKGW